MRKRIDEVTIDTTSFVESLDFSKIVPYSIRHKRFPYDNTVPLHYADTLEIIVTTDVIGNVIVGHEIHELEKNDVVIIPPYYVHSTVCSQCSGILYNIKVSFEYLKSFIDVEAIVELENKKMFNKLFMPEKHPAFMSIINRMISEDENAFSRMHCMLDIFELLCSNDVSVSASSKGNSNDEIAEKRLREIINWTNEHYMEHISLEQIAEKLYLSKYYLCKLFRKYTRITYMTYLNQVRLDKAFQRLRSGKNVSECAVECGFESVSYFIQQFRKYYGYTPGQMLHQSESTGYNTVVPSDDDINGKSKDNE